MNQQILLLSKANCFKARKKSFLTNKIIEEARTRKKEMWGRILTNKTGVK